MRLQNALDKSQRKRNVRPFVTQGNPEPESFVKMEKGMRVSCCLKETWPAGAVTEARAESLVRRLVIFTADKLSLKYFRTKALGNQTAVGVVGLSVLGLCVRGRTSAALFGGGPHVGIELRAAPILRRAQLPGFQP